jgi:zinc transport system substrate-binding protein
LTGGYRIVPLHYIIGIFVLCLTSWASAQKVVVASTSLTGAIALAAGAAEVRVITPVEVNHPPEYEVKPSDLLKLQGASIAVCGGYEKIVPKLVEASKNGSIVSLPVDTRTSPDNLIEQARKIAKLLSTEEAERAWESRFQAKLTELREKLRPFSGRRAVVHRQAEPFARFAGLNVVRILAPGELTPRTMAESIAAGPELVFDILHFPMAAALAQNAGCPYVRIINFPGVGRTKTLEDIFEYNAKQMEKAGLP